MKNTFKTLAFIAITFTPWLWINVLTGFAIGSVIGALLPTSLLAIPCAGIFFPETTNSNLK